MAQSLDTVIKNLHICGKGVDGDEAEAYCITECPYNKSGKVMDCDVKQMITDTLEHLLDYAKLKEQVKQQEEKKQKAIESVYGTDYFKRYFERK